jgi:flagellar biogenesis protein FliO
MIGGGDVPFTSAFLSLAVILLLLALAAWAARRLRGRGFVLGQNRNTSIAIIATRLIGPQASLMIVEAEQQRFLVGTGRAGVTVITPLGTAPEPFDSVLARATPPGDEP